MAKRRGGWTTGERQLIDKALTRFEKDCNRRLFNTSAASPIYAEIREEQRTAAAIRTRLFPD